jgi:transposase
MRIVEACHGRTISEVAREYQLAYTTVERWFYELAPTQLVEESPTRICVDEFAIRKGHSYATGVLNADTGRVLAVTNGRNQEAIQQALKTVQGNVAYIVSDLAPAMKKAIEEVFPKAIHVLDRFHVIQLITDALMRRRYYLDKKGKHQTVRHMNRLLTSEPGLLSEEDRKQVREWCLQDDNLSQLYKGFQ